MNKYKYEAFGLSISSVIEMNELIEIETQEIYDVYIKYAKIPPLTDMILISNEYCDVTKKELIIKVLGVGKFYVANGNEIIIEKERSVSEANIKLFVLGLSFGALLMQRKIFPLHGSAIKVKDKCVLILGESGAGKSSLSAGFVGKGYKILTDDVVATVNKQSDGYYIEPSYPQQKLSFITLNELNINKDKYKKVEYDDKREKYYIPRKEQFENNLMHIDYIIDLREKDILSVEINELKGMDKIGLLNKNTYGAFLVKYFNLSKDRFISFSKIATQAKFYMVSRPENIYTVDKQIEIIEQLIEIERVEECKTV